mmetsp:Transcript_17760/g.62572  ORF Transcript_17760/g.62572 Transcript_17760/m.62572 type:complete len:278 (-) Transcript_17760:1390-2223(-)
MPTIDVDSLSSTSPRRRPIAYAVSSASPVIIVTRTPERRSVCTASATPSRGGSRMPTNPRKHRPSLRAPECARGVPRGCASGTTGPEASAMTRRPRRARSRLAVRTICSRSSVSDDTSPPVPVSATVHRSNTASVAPLTKNVSPEAGSGVCAPSSSSSPSNAAARALAASARTVRASASTVGVCCTVPAPPGRARTAIHLSCDENGISNVRSHAPSDCNPSLPATTTRAASVAEPTACPPSTCALLHTTAASIMAAMCGCVDADTFTPAAVIVPEPP